MERRSPRLARGQGSLRRAVVAAAAVVLALAALGFLIWFLVTRSAGKQAWLASLATIVAVVLPTWGMAVAMLTWVRKSRTADADRARESGPGQGGRLPRPLSDLDPFDLEVHRPLQAGTAGQLPVLPRYVPREHDVRLRQVADQAARGESRLAVVVGGSSTGKTRACWEMLDTLRGCAPQWRLWHPIDPARPDAVLAGLSQVGPRTVVWLNEAQLYLETSDDIGERVAAGLRGLLRDPGRRPVLVVATLWPRHWDTLTTRAEPDRHAQARELLSGHNIEVPERFSAGALSALARAASTDPRLADAAAHAANGQITQYLAGAPILLDRYQHSPPAARALIQVAMDARRLGCGPYLPLALLEAAAPGYLTDTEWDQLDDDWLDQALTSTAEPRNGIPGPLTRIRPRDPGPHPGGAAPGAGHDGAPLYRLADYLDQHGRRHRHALIPPRSFWTAAPGAQPADLTALGVAAHDRGLLRAAAQLYKHACHRDATAAVCLVRVLHQCGPADHRAAQWAAGHAALDDPRGAADLLGALREAGAQDQVTALLARDPAGHAALDDPRGAADLLGALREAGAQDQVTALLARDPAGHAALDDPYRVADLLSALREAGAQDQFTALADRAAGHAALDKPRGAADLLSALREAGAQDQVTALADRAAGHAALDDPYRVADLLGRLREAGAQDQVTALLARDPAGHAVLDNPVRVAVLLRRLREAGAQDQVTALLARDPAGHAALDDPGRVAVLLRRLREAGAQDQFTALADRAAGHAALDKPRGAAVLLGALREAGAQDQVTALADRAAGHAALDKPYGVADLLSALREAGAQDQVTALLARDPAGHAVLDDPYGVADLLRRLREAGAQDQVTALLARDPAGHAALDDPGRVADLLGALREAGAQDQFTALADRAAGHAALDKPRGAADLLSALREAGAHEQVTLLTDRLPSEGSFDLFCAQGNNQALYRFGRDPGGKPARSWGWDDLN